MSRLNTAAGASPRRSGRPDLLSTAIDVAEPGEGRSRAARPRSVVRRVVVGGYAVMVAAVAACSSGSTPAAPSGSGSGSAAVTANVAAAKAAISSFTGKPSAFPVSEPLSKRLPAGTKFALLNCGTPGCTAGSKSLQAAVSAIGGVFNDVNAGSTAATSQAAAASLLALKPDVVFVTVDPSLYGDALKKMSDAGIKVISVSIVKDVTPFGITFNFIGDAAIKQQGKLMADWAIANKDGKANAVFYGLPAFDFSKPMQQAFEDEIKQNCPSCTVRSVPIDVATLGTTSPRTIVTDLQSHPTTNVAAFLTLGMAAGVPAAMSAAGLSMTTVGRGPTPGNLQDIKDGALTAALALDQNVAGWVEVDAAARLLLGDQPTAAEKAGDLPLQFLEQKDINFDPTKGWIAYPDYPQRFATLWHMGG